MAYLKTLSCLVQWGPPWPALSEAPRTYAPGIFKKEGTPRVKEGSQKTPGPKPFKTPRVSKWVQLRGWGRLAWCIELVRFEASAGWSPSQGAVWVVVWRFLEASDVTNTCKDVQSCKEPKPKPHEMLGSPA